MKLPQVLDQTLSLLPRPLRSHRAHQRRRSRRRGRRLQRPRGPASPAFAAAVLSFLAPRSTTPDSIKEQLPIINFAEFTTRAGIIRGKNNDNDSDDRDEEEDEAATCAAYMVTMRGGSWANAPMCSTWGAWIVGWIWVWWLAHSANLYWCLKTESMVGKESWDVERISCLFSEDVVMSRWADYHQLLDSILFHMMVVREFADLIFFLHLP